MDLLDADGRLNSVAVAHRDPDRVLLVEELRRRFPADPASPVGIYAVARTGEAMIIPEIDDARLQQTARDEDHLKLIRSLQLRSWMCAPMVVGGRILGTISFAGAESGRTFGQRHLRFAVDLAARAGAAIENARTFQAADRFRQILDAVAEAIFVLEPSGDVVQGVNHGASELLGRPASDLVGRRLSDLVDDAVSQGVDRVMHATFGSVSRCRAGSSGWPRPSTPGPPS
jgi:GAF domain-containing protein